MGILLLPIKHILAPATFEDILSWCVAPSPNSKLKRITKLLLQAYVYEIWKQRNSRIHTLVSRPTSSIIKDIQLTLRAKLAVLDKAHPTHLNPRHGNQSYLYNWFEYFQRSPVPQVHG